MADIVNVANAFLQRALEAQDRKDHHGALALFQQALADEPQSWVGHTGLGNSLRALGRLDEAVAACTRGVEAAGDVMPAWTQLALAYQAQGLWTQARLCFRRACALEPENADAWCNLAALELAADDFAAAETAGRRALALSPAHARAAINLGRARKEQGAFSEAIALYQRALASEPDNSDAGWNLGLVLLQEERWAEGWPLHELRTGVPSAAGVPLWDGRPLGGATVLVQAEKGLGDAIQFARYLRLLKTAAGAGRVVLECQPPLRRLFAGCLAVDAVVARGEALPAVDRRAPMMSLPLLLRAFDPAASASAAYLQASPERVAFWRDELSRRGQRGETARIGIAWQGNPAYRADARRSIPLPALQPAIARAHALGMTVYSLQKGCGSEQVARLAADAPVIDLGPALDNDGPGGAFVDTAAVMANLDLVISSDTAVPHLGGALGAPVWLLLARIPDWRWGSSGETTPWYPSLRLFRQSEPGDWAGVVNDVCAALNTLPATERKPS